MRKVMSKFVFSFVMLTVLYSCGSDKQTTEKRSVFRYNEAAGISSLDPAASTNDENIRPVNQIFNGLVQLNDTLQVIPCIAKSWSISSDGLNYIFKLRNDVYFQDNEVFDGGKGRKVIASDFVYSFLRLNDPKVSSAMSLMNFLNKTKNGGVEAIDDSTLAIYLKEQFSPFLGVMTMKFFSVIPKEAVAKYGDDFRRNPVGTGPFKFKLWEEGTKLILVKNENYFETENGKRLPYLDAVTVSFMKDKETSFMQFLKGDFDMLSGIDAFNPKEVLDGNGQLKHFYQDKFNLQTIPYVKTDYFGFQIDESIDFVKKGALRLKAIRQAINYGFDREKLIKFFRNNLGVPAVSGFIPSGMMSYNPKKVIGYNYNPEKVKQLLAEAGFPGGKGLPEITIHSSDGYSEILEFIQGQLSENGIKISISIDQPNELKKSVANNQVEFFRKSWICDYADEENFMSLFYSKNFSPVGFNYFHYKNPEFDKLYEAALIEQHPIKRMEMYQKMDQMVINDAPIVPLYYDQVVRLVGKNVQGLSLNSMNILNLKKVHKTN